MARPKKPIDEETVRKLAHIHCTNDEIASFFGVDTRTLERRYAPVIRQARDEGKMSLRRKQVEVAMSGNAQLLVWLGKVYLGQKDSTTIQLTDEIVDTYISQKQSANRSTEELD